MANKRLPIIDPVTGLEIVEHHVLKTASNHTELEGQTFGLGPDVNFLNIVDRKPKKKITARNTPNLINAIDKTVCLFPPIAGGNEVFLSHIDFSNERKKDTTYIYEPYRPFRYTNGQNGLSHSLSIFPCMSHDDMLNRKRYTWKDKPTTDYIYNDKGIKNRELTFYLKVGKPVPDTGLKRIAVRLGGAWNVGNPTLRSYVEIGYPTQDYPDVYFDVAYAAGRNVLVRTVNQYFAGDRIVSDRWIGLKLVSQVADNNSHIWYGVYTDLSPFASSEDNDDKHGIPLNNWQLKADLIFTGVKEYNNIIPTWKCEVDSIVVEGYESAIFKGVSDREVDFMGLKPLHQDMSVIVTQSDDLLFRKAMIPQFNLNDFEDMEEMMNVKDNETIPTRKKSSHTKLSLPREDRDSDPKDPGFYGIYTD